MEIVDHGDGVGRIAEFGTQEFLDTIFDPKPGEHVSLIGPTGKGKTALSMAMMQRCTSLNRKTRGLVLVMKPHQKARGRVSGDKTVSRYIATHGAKLIRKWPPPPLLGRTPPPYYVLWPAHDLSRDVDRATDRERRREILAAALRDCYRHGDWWVNADEVYHLSEVLDLSDELIEWWTSARSLDSALIAATQKPTHVPTWMYSQAYHLAVWRDPDRAARRRYGEIGGVDPKVLETVTNSLGHHDFVYVHRPSDSMCVVRSDGRMPDV